MEKQLIIISYNVTSTTVENYGETICLAVESDSTVKADRAARAWIKENRPQADAAMFLSSDFIRITESIKVEEKSEDAENREHRVGNNEG